MEDPDSLSKRHARKIQRRVEGTRDDTALNLPSLEPRDKPIGDSTEDHSDDDGDVDAGGAMVANRGKPGSVRSTVGFTLGAQCPCSPLYAGR